MTGGAEVTRHDVAAAFERAVAQLAAHTLADDEVVTDAVAAVDGMIAAPLGEVGKLAAAVATARRPTGAARALVSFVRTRTPIARPGSHAFPSRRYLTT